MGDLEPDLDQGETDTPLLEGAESDEAPPPFEPVENRDADPAKGDDEQRRRSTST